EWVHVQLHQQKGMISLSPPTICNSAVCTTSKSVAVAACETDTTAKATTSEQNTLRIFIVIYSSFLMFFFFMRRPSALGN
ncbi:hypothetical protein, partial [Enterobacter hormaechei]|uniref:hypothetical protein n=1 Tax=Enterobacter hormaechei TaxID=158836 RepID=UPI001A947BE3